MNKKALLGLSVALLLPVCCYLILKYASDSAVDMPRHLLMDTVIERIDRGKIQSDTVWHTTKNITLVNQLGDTVSLYDKPGKILVVDFFFTRCGGICPKLTKNMALLQVPFVTPFFPEIQETFRANHPTLSQICVLIGGELKQR